VGRTRRRRCRRRSRSRLNWTRKKWDTCRGKALRCRCGTCL
jgi:hypothetical protein